MDDSQSCAFGKDPSGNKPFESPGGISKPDRYPEITLESERGAGGSDEASDSKVNPGENGCPTLPENQGVESSNTTPSNHHCLTMSPIDTLSTGGLDWLSLNLHGAFSDSYWDLIQDQFENAKQSAIDGNLLESFVKLPSGLELQMAPNGTGKGQSYCKWVFKYQGITFKLRDSQSALSKKGHLRNVSVDIPSFPLMAYGESEVLKLIRLILDLLGYSIERIAPSRVDMCVDLVDVPVALFDEAFKKRCYVSRIRRNHQYSNNHVVETIVFGGKGSKTSLRIYNKDLETLNNPEKRQLLKVLRWGKRPDPELGATRVEFQIRRDHLRDQHGIINYDDLVSKRWSLGRWLTHDWIRFTDIEPRPGHSDRVGPSALWQKVIDAFDSWTGQRVEERSKRTLDGGDISRLVTQICGCLTSAIAKVGVIPRNRKEMEFYITKFISPNYDSMIQAVDMKRKLLVANQPYEPISLDDHQKGI